MNDLERRLANVEHTFPLVNPDHIRIARETEACYRALMPDGLLDTPPLPPMTDPLERAHACYDRLMGWIRDGMPGCKTAADADT